MTLLKNTGNSTGNGGEKVWRPEYDLRTHNIFNLYNFEVRPDKVTEENPNDILWVRMESEAIIPLYMFGTSNTTTEFKSVRQYVINAVEDNTEKAEDGIHYKYRPYVLFYDGPEKINMKSHMRDSKPVILSLNANFRGILFAPNSSVILLNPDGYKFYGFIVAKEYMEVVKEGTPTHYDNNIYVDDNGEVKCQRSSIMNFGEYDDFNIGSFNNYNYEVENNSQGNLFIY